MTVAVQRRHFQQAVVVGVAGLHDAAIPVPMTRTKPLGNDQIQRPAYGVNLGPTEDACRGLVPEDNRPRRVGYDNRVGKIPYQLRERVVVE